MTYKAKQNIGDYKKGDIVPDQLAQTWSKMYEVSPVEEVVDVETKVQKEVTAKKEKVESKVQTKAPKKKR